MPTLHRVKVLGRNLNVRSNSPTEQVGEIESFVNGKIAEIEASFKGGDQQVVAILALLNIAEAYLGLEKKYKAGIQENREKISRLLQRMEVGL